MLKWYAPSTLLLVSALALSSTGCASSKWSMSSLWGRGDEAKLAEIDSEKSKDKARSKSKDKISDAAVADSQDPTRKKSKPKTAGDSQVAANGKATGKSSADSAKQPGLRDASSGKLAVNEELPSKTRAGRDQVAPKTPATKRPTADDSLVAGKSKDSKARSTGRAFEDELAAAEAEDGIRQTSATKPARDEARTSTSMKSRADKPAAIAQAQDEDPFLTDALVPPEDQLDHIARPKSAAGSSSKSAKPTATVKSAAEPAAPKSSDDDWMNDSYEPSSRVPRHEQHEVAHDESTPSRSAVRSVAASSTIDAGKHSWAIDEQESAAETDSTARPVVQPGAAPRSAAGPTAQAARQGKTLGQSGQLPQGRARLTETDKAATRATKSSAAPTAARSGNSASADSSSPTAAETPKSATAKRLLAKCPQAEGEVRTLVESLDTSDAETLKRQLHQLGQLEQRAIPAQPAVEELLQHSDPYVSVHAALALHRMQVRRDLSTATVVRALRSSDPAVRSFAATAAGELATGNPELLAALSSALNDNDGYVRLHAAEVLARHEEYSYRATSALLDCLQDADHNVRWLSTYSLAELAPQRSDVVQALTRRVSDSEPRVRVGAVYALGEIGPLAKSAENELQMALTDPNADLRAAAAYALQQIGG